VPYQDEKVLSVAGTVNAAAMLLVLMLASATLTWFSMGDVVSALPPLFWPALLLGLAAALLGFFRPRAARFASPVYAIAQGVVVGSVSRVYDAAYGGIVLQAVGSTAAVFVVMLLLYRSKVIKVTGTFRRVVVGATFGVMLFYAFSLILSLFGSQPSFLFSAGITGVLFSGFVTGLAALNLTLDFDLIERAAQERRPAYMEWYCALGLLVTLVWIYLEILRLLAKLRSR
jgi:uncharacterized YccA/Bax inhibitor family protein